MRYILEGYECEPYSFICMKDQLLKWYGDKIVRGDIAGRPDVVTFKSTALSILHDFHHQPNKSADKTRMVRLTSDIIKSDIKSIIRSKDQYPSSDEMV